MKSAEVLVQGFGIVFFQGAIFGTKFEPQPFEVELPRPTGSHATLSHGFESMSVPWSRQ